MANLVAANFIDIILIEGKDTIKTAIIFIGTT